MSLAGKFFIHFAKDHYHIGEVVDQISPEVILVRFDESEIDGVSPMVLVNISLLLTKMNKDGCPHHGCDFFSSHEDLNDFLDRVSSSDDDGAAAKPVSLVN